MAMSEPTGKLTRRGMLAASVRGACLLGTGAAAVSLARGGDEEMVWQIDPYKCTACGNCRKYCVLTPSAVKCINNHKQCVHCEECFGYYVTDRAEAANSGVEKQLCPTDAIIRRYGETIPGEGYEYTINEPLCVACGLCVKWCRDKGLKSLYLQIRHDRCVNCNDCAIAAACPAGAVVRVPASDPFIEYWPDGEKP